MRSCPLLLALILVSCSKPDLAHRVQAKLQVAMPDATVEIVDPTTLKVKRGAVEQTLSLDNLQQACGESNGACESGMDRFVASASAVTGELPLDLKSIRAVLKSSAAVDQMRSLVASSPAEKRADNSLFMEPFGGDLFVVLVLDMPDGIAMLTHGSAKSLGLDEASAKGLARANLAKAITTLPLEDAAPGVLRVSAGDDYEAARLLVPKLWDEAARRVSGELLVIASNRNTVFATGDKDPAAIARMKELATKAFTTQPYGLSTMVFQRTDKGFVPASDARK